MTNISIFFPGADCQHRTKLNALKIFHALPKIDKMITPLFKSTHLKRNKVQQYIYTYNLIHTLNMLLVPVWDVFRHLHVHRFLMKDVDSSFHPIRRHHLTGQFIHGLGQFTGKHLCSSCLLCTHAECNVNRKWKGVKGENRAKVMGIPKCACSMTWFWCARQILI